MRKIIISILFALVFSMTLMAYADNAQKGIAAGVVRLHIIANSDDVYDQDIKLKVRDAIIDELAPVLSNVKDQSEAEKIIINNLTKAEAAAQKVLIENGLDYGAQAMYAKSHFPTKKYENIILPPGDYDALKIVLGNGEGHNWWCVMYPPLCFEGSVSGVIDDAQAEALKRNIGNDGYELITEYDSIPVNFKFKILEIFDKLCK